MWEITLCGKYEDILYLVDMENILKETFSKDIISVIWVNDDVICNLATNNLSNIDYIKKIIVETILKIAKKSFFSDNLKLNINDNNLKSFLISSLVMIDLEEEINFVYNHNIIEKYINISSFILFKLRDLEEKWLFLINYINSTFFNRYEEYLYLDFLKFLTDLQTPRYDILYLEKNDNSLDLIDQKNKKIKSVSLSDEVGVIVNLIILCPKKIIIKCIDNLSNKFSNLVSYIFEEKLFFLL